MGMKTQQSISTNQLLIFGVIIALEIFIYLISLVSFILISSCNVNFHVDIDRKLSTDFRSHEMELK